MRVHSTGCSSLKHFVIPGAVNNIIGEFSIAECSALEDITFENTTSLYLGEGAICNCESLHPSLSQKGLDTLAENSIYGCRSLTDVYYKGTKAEWDQIEYGVGGTTAAWSQFEHPEITVHFLEEVEPANDPENKGGDEENSENSGPEGKEAKEENTESGTEDNSTELTILFTDVKDGKYYTDAVAWAVENGITQGTSPTTFGPDEYCTRGQVVTFLWRSQNRPSMDLTEIFTDVSPDAYYAQAVAWAGQNGITQGTSNTTFGPNDICTRGHVVTFLYRSAH